MDDMVDELDKRKGHSVRMCDGRTLFDKLKAEQKKSAEISAYWKDYLMGGSLKEMFKLSSQKKEMLGVGQNKISMG